jgi:hypothetical protein
MANELELGAGLKLTNPAPADAYYTKPQGGDTSIPAQPYASVAEACAIVPLAVRYPGMAVAVLVAGQAVRHAWKAGVANNQLVPDGGGDVTLAEFEAVKQDVSQLESDLNDAEVELQQHASQLDELDDFFAYRDAANGSYITADDPDNPSSIVAGAVLATIHGSSGCSIQVPAPASLNSIYNSEYCDIYDGGRNQIQNSKDIQIYGSDNLVLRSRQCTIPNSCNGVTLINCDQFSVPAGTTDAVYISNALAGTGGPVRDIYGVGDNASLRGAVKDVANTWVKGDLVAFAEADKQTVACPPAVAGQPANVLVGEADVQPGDTFDDVDDNGEAWRFTYCRRNDGTLGWTRLPKPA